MKKPILRFRFIIVFALLLILAVFVIYMLSTSLEDVIGDDKSGSKPETSETEIVTTAPESLNSVVYVETTTTEPPESEPEG